MKTMQARFAGKCSKCNGSISKGETIVYNGTASHVECPARAYPYTKEGEAAHVASLPKVGLIRFTDYGCGVSVNVFAGMVPAKFNGAPVMHETWPEVAAPKYRDLYSKWCPCTQTRATYCG